MSSMILALLAGTLGAAGGAALSLDAALRTGLSESPEMRAAQIAIREADGAALAASGRYDFVLEAEASASTASQTAVFGTGAFGTGPAEEQTLDTTVGQLGVTLTRPLVWGTAVSVGWTNLFTSTDNPFNNCIPGVPSEECYETRFELQISQPLLRGAGRAVGEADLTRAAERRTVADQARAQTANGVAERIVAAYVELAYARADVAIRGRALALATEQLEATEARIEVGQLAPAEAPAAKQAVADAERAAFEAARLAQDRQTTLASLLGADPGEDTLGPVALPTVGAAPPALTDALAAADAANPDLAVRRADLKRVRTELVPLEDALRPRLDIGGLARVAGLDEDYAGTFGAIPDTPTSLYAINLTLQMPLENRAAEGRHAEFQATVERLEAELAGARRTVAEEVTRAWRSVQSADRGVRYAERAAELAAESLEAARGKFELGRTTSFEVADHQQRLAEAELRVARARADRHLARTRLQALTGRLLAAYGLAVD